MPLPAILAALLPKAVDVVDKLVPDKDLKEKLKHELEKEMLAANLQLEMKQQETMQEIERTHQAELNQSDVFTKQTRPRIARESWRLCVGYALIAFGCMAIQKEDAALKFDAAVFGTIAAPALWYMGMRGMEKTAAFIKGRQAK